MSILALTAYILVWPLMTAGVLALLIAAIVRDLRRAKEEDRGFV